MHTIVLTTSGVVKPASGQIYHLQITNVATGAGAVTVYDNPSAASGNVLWTGSGLSAQDYDLTNGSGTGTLAATGIYVALAGTTNATVVVSYD